MNELKNFEQRQTDNLYWCFFGGWCQQNPQAVLSINRLLNFYNFNTIIELGTHTGGLSILLALHCLQYNLKNSADPKTLHTFDNQIRDQDAIKILVHLAAKFERRDILHSQPDIDYVRNLIASSAPTLLLCDNGDKKKEFELYAPSLKRGDIVMLHDWAFDESARRRNVNDKIWTAWETRWENGEKDTEQFGIKEICEKNNIEQIHAEEFDSCVWFCGIKK